MTIMNSPEWPTTLQPGILTCCNRDLYPKLLAPAFRKLRVFSLNLKPNLLTESMLGEDFGDIVPEHFLTWLPPAPQALRRESPGRAAWLL